MDENTWYVSLFGGVSWQEDIETTSEATLVSPGVSFDTTFEFKSGYLAGAAIGARLSDIGLDWFRLEAEASYTRYKGDSYDYEPAGGGAVASGSGDLEGHLEAIYVLGNLWIDLDLGMGLVPYIGGGAGVAFLDLDANYVPTNFGIASDRTEFAFQAGGGVKWWMSDSVALEVGYRFRGIPDVEFEATGSVSNTFGTQFDDDDLYSHHVLGGLTLGF